MGEITDKLPLVSVIIPTYNRKDSLLRTLDSLRRQTYPPDRFDVIVVDDGGSDGTGEAVQVPQPYALHYVRQENQGDALARNRGFELSCGEIVVFLDDDITASPAFISAMVDEHLRDDKLVLVGRLLSVDGSLTTPFRRAQAEVSQKGASNQSEIHFTEVLSGILSVRRQSFEMLGMMRPIVERGSSVWCDVDFAYRAYLQGFRFRRCADAVGYHDDYAVLDLATACHRAQRAALAGASLLHKYPGLKEHIRAFRDKGPIAWGQDSLMLTLRKLARQAMSSQPALRAMERAVPVLEHHAPESICLRLLYRWILSGYIYRGYRQGLQELLEGGAIA